MTMPQAKLLNMSNELAQLAADRYEITDALHRFAFGLDHGDADSLASVLTDDCILDFCPAGKKLGLDFGKVSGRQAIIETLIPLLGPLDRKSTRLNSSHPSISYAVFCLKKKKEIQ